jgi:hypothetical protein
MNHDAIPDNLLHRKYDIQVLRILRRKDETIASLQMELAESTELRHKANRDLELAVPSPESVLQECQRLRMSLDAEVASHERTKASLGVVQHALADMTLARRQSEEARTTAAASGGTRKQQLELASLRENNIDLSEQVQVPVHALRLHCTLLHCLFLNCIVSYLTFLVRDIIKRIDLEIIIAFLIRSVIISLSPSLPLPRSLNRH